MKTIGKLLFLLCVSMALCVSCGDEPEITKKDDQTEESRNDNQDGDEQNQNEENSNDNNHEGGETSDFSAITTVEGIIETVVSDVTVNAVSLESTIAFVDEIWMTECGVCVGTSPNTTIENSLFKYSYTRYGNEGNENERCVGLPSNTSYFARTYVINDQGVSYGNIVEFKTLQSKSFSYCTGAIPAYFSVSETNKVAFSKGNLQYHCANKEWRFAEHQYDMIGEDNKYIFVSYNGWIDLFGWGTSGYNSKYPYMTSTYSRDYGDGEKDIAGTNYDWGVYNAISNGGNAAGMWRTLTKDEWKYVLSQRTNASSLKGSATVNGVSGIILLPDNWTTPDGVTFKSGMNVSSNNTYSTSDWAKMEANGAVFLPAAGDRGGSGVSSVGSYGNYWSSSELNGNVYNLYFDSDGAYMYSGSGRHFGQSVRLARDLE